MIYVNMWLMGTTRAVLPERSGPGSDTADGRHRRRAANRHAVVEALLSFYDEGSLDPSIAEVAEVAGLSPRSVFRYFDDAEDLTRAAIELQQQRLAPLFPLDIDTAAPVDDRVGRFVAHRVQLLEAMGNVGRVARQRGHSQPLIGAELTRVRGELRAQLAATFAPELAAAAHAPTMLAGADVAVSFEAYDLLRNDHGLDVDAAAHVMAASLSAIVVSHQP